MRAENAQSQAQELRQKGDVAGAQRLEQQAQGYRQQAEDYAHVANNPALRHQKGDGFVANDRRLTPEQAVIRQKTHQDSLRNQANGLVDVANNGPQRSQQGIYDLQNRINAQAKAPKADQLSTGDWALTQMQNPNLKLNNTHKAELQGILTRETALQQKLDGKLHFEPGETRQDVQNRLDRIPEQRRQWEAQRVQDLVDAKNALGNYTRNMGNEANRSRVLDNATAAQELAGDLKNNSEIQEHRREISRQRQEHNDSFNNNEIAGDIIYGDNRDTRIHKDGGHRDQQLWLNQATGQQLVQDRDGNLVPRNLYRNITGNKPKLGSTADLRSLNRGDGILPVAPSSDAVALAHAGGKDTSFSSFTTNPGTIVNAKDQPFNRNGKVEVDAYQFAPTQIVDLRSAPELGRSGPQGFPHLNNNNTRDDQASRDVIRTQEVLVQGDSGSNKAIPNRAVTSNRDGNPIIFDAPGKEGTRENQGMIDQLRWHPERR
jgi:hypothetical protein